VAKASKRQIDRFVEIARKFGADPNAPRVNEVLKRRAAGPPKSRGKEAGATKNKSTNVGGKRRPKL